MFHSVLGDGGYDKDLPAVFRAPYGFLECCLSRLPALPNRCRRDIPYRTDRVEAHLHESIAPSDTFEGTLAPRRGD